MTKLLSRLLNLALSVVIGALAGALFKQLWKLTAGEEQAPQAADPEAELERGPARRGPSGCAVRNGQGRRAARRRARPPQAPRPGYEIVTHQERPAAAKETAHLVSENVTGTRR
jgi:hypothetical protein